MNHRLPEIWTDPEKFDPDRFTEPRNEHKRHRYAFTPFGGGAHKCIGMVFGQLEVKTIMHRLLRRYRLELPYAGLQAALGLRRHAGADGRYADRAAAAALGIPRFGSWRQPVRARDHRAQRRLGGVGGPAHRPFGAGAVAAVDEGGGVPPGPQLVELQHLDGDAAVVQHRGECGDGPAGRDR